MSFIIQTERIRVRRIDERDFDELMAVYGDLELMKYVGDSTALSKEDCRKWIEITKNNYKIRGYGLFAIERIGQEIIGFGGISHPDGQVQPEIKYTLKKAFWGQGIATEFVREITQVALSEWKLPEVIATIDPENTASARVLEKAGYSRGADTVDENQFVTQVWYRRPDF